MAGIEHPCQCTSHIAVCGRVVYLSLVKGD